MNWDRIKNIGWVWFIYFILFFFKLKLNFSKPKPKSSLSLSLHIPATTCNILHHYLSLTATKIHNTPPSMADVWLISKKPISPNPPRLSLSKISSTTISVWLFGWWRRSCHNHHLLWLALMSFGFGGFRYDDGFWSLICKVRMMVGLEVVWVFGVHCHCYCSDMKKFELFFWVFFYLEYVWWVYGMVCYEKKFVFPKVCTFIVRVVMLEMYLILISVFFFIGVFKLF